MSIADWALYQGAKLLRSSEVAHSADMKAALQDKATSDQFRAAEINRVLWAIQAYGLSLAGREVLDFGCNDGALSAGYLNAGASHVTGVDVDEAAVRRARQLRGNDRLTFLDSTVSAVRLPDASIDAVVSFDVFEHVSQPAVILTELSRVLRPSGWILIGTWSWRHPFAPHLWSTMPVPWAHLLVSERTLLRACRRVYHAPWYRPVLHDFDEAGQRLPDRYTEQEISREYLNHYLISDFEPAFHRAGFACDTHTLPFGSRYARWTAPLVRLPWFREFLSGFVWFVLRKPSGAGA